MLYIHKLADFGRKSADIESVYLIRDIKKKLSVPLSHTKMEEHFADFFVSATDISVMQTALDIVSETTEMIEHISATQDPVYEAANIQRTLQVVKNCPLALSNNIKYCNSILEWQTEFIITVTELLNIIPNLKSAQDKQETNTQLSNIFEKILRNNDLAFNYSDIVHEGHIGSLNALMASIDNGFLFHKSLEEELKKLTFEVIRSRIPNKSMDDVNNIRKNIEIINKGITKAYEVNMRMVECSLNLYSFVKWLNA